MSKLAILKKAAKARSSSPSSQGAWVHEARDAQGKWTTGGGTVTHHMQATATKKAKAFVSGDTLTLRGDVSATVKGDVAKAWTEHLQARSKKWHSGVEVELHEHEIAALKAKQHPPIAGSSPAPAAAPKAATATSKPPAATKTAVPKAEPVPQPAPTATKAPTARAEAIAEALKKAAAARKGATATKTEPKTPAKATPAASKPPAATKTTTKTPPKPEPTPESARSSNALPTLKFKNEDEAIGHLKKQFSTWQVRDGALNLEEATRIANLTQELAHHAKLDMKNLDMIIYPTSTNGRLITRRDGSLPRMELGIVDNPGFNGQIRQEQHQMLRDTQFKNDPEERQRLDKAIASMKSGRRDYCYSYTAERFENTGEGIMRHEMGHYFHLQNNDLFTAHFGRAANYLNRYPIGGETELCKKYRVSTYGSQNFAECAAENFALYSAGMTNQLHPDMLAFFRKHTTYGY